MGARGNFAQDIAIIKLKTAFELTGLIRPVCIDWDNVLEREHLQVGRFGKVIIAIMLLQFDNLIK